MDTLVSHEVYRSFEHDEQIFAGLSGEAVAALASAGCDLGLVVSTAGEILDVSFKDRSFKAWKPEEWIGRAWADTVTAESRDKIGELLQETMHWPLTRPRQVNHPAPGSRDLPVSYRLVSFPGWPHRIALGADLRAMADMQQRFVRSQVEMERDYRKLRDVESRYRVLFFLAGEPLVVVDSQTLRVLDANEEAERFFDRSAKKITGSPAVGLFAKTDAQAASETLALAGAQAQAATFSARPATRGDPMEITVTPFREFGRTSLLVSFGAGGDRKLGTRAAETHRLGAVVETLPEGIVLVDNNGLIIDANPSFLDLVRVVSLDRVVARSLDNWLGGSSVDVQVLMANLREHGLVRRFSSVVRDELGGIENVDVSASLIVGKGEPHYGFAIREAVSLPSLGTGPGAAAQNPASQFTDLVGRVPLKDLVRDTADIIEKLCIEAALRLTDNNRASAADMLGLSRQSLYIKLRRFGITDFGADEEA